MSVREKYGKRRAVQVAVRLLVPPRPTNRTMTKEIPAPSVHETAFPCPHCGAYARQSWADCIGERIGGDSPVPRLPDIAKVEERRLTTEAGSRNEAFLEFYEWAKSMASGEPFIKWGSSTGHFTLHNVFIS